jgi:hypothetical protein
VRRRRAERGRQGDQFLDRDPALSILTSLHRVQVPAKAFGEGFLRQASPLPQLVKRLGDVI